MYMPALTTILCPVDLSDASRRSLDVGLALARRHRAVVRVVQVIDSGAWTGTRSEALFELNDEQRTALAEKLRAWVAAAETGQDLPDVRLLEGPAVAGILREAEAMDASLIVMGTHGKGGFERLALGSVTEKVLRKASCPVLVVPAADEGATAGAGEFHRVVCATDFSAPSARALSYARLLAGAAKAPVSLLTVIDWPFGQSSGNDPVTRLRQSLEQQAADELNALATQGDGPPAEIVVRRGNPGREILAFARECPVDLIVMGVSGRGAVDLALLGSTAHRVLREAVCPVLTVPATPEAVATDQ
jgi:nucleotide-binding universal stress UspA family protein